MTASAHDSPRDDQHKVAAPAQSLVTSRPIAVLMIFVAAIVFGFFSYKLLPLQLMPNLSYPTITVRTEYAGAAPEEVENDVSRPIEEALGVIGGLSRISSISRADVSDVVLEFDWDTDMSEATQDALEKLDLVFLPQEAKRPRILHYDPSLDPIMELSLAGSGPEFAGEAGLRRLRRIAELQIKRELEPLKGVAAVRIKGGFEEEIHVLLREDELRRTGISIKQVIDRLAQENINVAGGKLTEGRTEYMVRTLNEFQSLAQIEDTVVASFAGRDVRIKDLGQVESAHKDRQILTRTNGSESVQIEIFKEADANIVALAHRVKEALKPQKTGSDDKPAAKTQGRQGDDLPKGLAAQLRANEGVDLAVVADRSLFIESSLNEVRNTAIMGGLLAVLILFLFLRNLRTTLIIAVSIPLSLIVAFAPLHLLDVTLNIMSLGGLALGVGMLVDSSIVVLESIFRRREEGDDIVTAAVRGTEEVGGAVLASTLTTIAVFFPMVFVKGVAGQAFSDLGLAVVVSLSASLAVALYFVPMLASRRGMQFSAEASVRPLFALQAPAAFAASWRSSGRITRFLWLPFQLILLVCGVVLEIIGLILAGIPLLLFGLFLLVARVVRPIFAAVTWLPLWAAQSFFDWLYRTYPPLIRSALRQPVVIAALVVAVSVATVQMARNLDSELLPEVHQGEVTFEVTLPVGTPLDQTDAILASVERAILAERDHINALILTIGYDASNIQSSDEGEHTARFKVLLDSKHRDAHTEDAVVARLRAHLREVPDLDLRVARPVLFSARTAIEIEVHGDDLTRLRSQGDRVREVMAGLRQLTDVETTLRRGSPEVQVVYDRDLLARHGLNIGTVAALVRDKVKGNEATRFNRLDRRVPIVVRLDDADRETVADIAALMVNPGDSRPIPLSSVGEVKLGEGPSEVRRVDGRRIALVRANIAEGSLGSVTATIDQALRTKVEWPSDMTFYIAGQTEEWERSRTSLWLALALSIFLVYVIMAAQFESLAQPFVIMFTIPLAFFGTMLTLELMGISLSVVVFLGMIMLAGIVVNNAIVLVDYINVLRGRGVELDEAIVTAGEVRLRPIFLTTATTILGLLPMAFGLGDGAEIRTPMALAVVSGLTTSTILTLLVIPSFYAVVERARARLWGEPVTVPPDTEIAPPAGHKLGLRGTAL